MNYWLMKSEPDVYSLETLRAEPTGSGCWDGVRNYQARNYLREQQPGDLIFFYHSSCAVPGIVGIAEVVAAASVDPTQFDASSPYFDPRVKPDAPRWVQTRVRFVRALKAPITLERLRQVPALNDFPLLQRGTRLSVLPVSKPHWQLILSLE
jgi:predicted RNA-binding protein with PUA-like domain